MANKVLVGVGIGCGVLVLLGVIGGGVAFYMAKKTFGGAIEAGQQMAAQENDLKALANGKAKYTTYCAPCHGDTGMGNGPVSAAYPGRPGPFAGVFPLIGLTTGRSDGYLYNVIRVGGGGVPGFRMPDYKRIPSQDRWDIVNYVRYLDRRGGQP